MFIRRLLLIVVICVLSCSGVTNAESKDCVPYLKERLSSEWWQVRYCLLLDLKLRNENHKKLLEQLAVDENEQVSSQALERYVSNFLEVDKNLIIPRIEKMNPILDGMYFVKQPDVRSVAFYSSMLDIKKIDDASNARWIKFIGIIGKPEDAMQIKPYMESQNDYVLMTTARALFRLGDSKSCMAILKKILGKDVKKHIYYQTEALYALAEIDKKMCVDEYRKLRRKVEEHKDIQPNWVSGHVFQGLELNIH